MFLLAAASLCACSQQPSTTTTGKGSGKSLVVYYSQSHSTEKIAKLFQAKTGADLDSIVAEQPYDGDFQQTIMRCQKEMADSIVPAIKPLNHNIADYDTIYLGYPVWFGIYAQPIAGFIKAVDLSGKVIIPFCTFGSGGTRTSTSKLAQALPNSTLLRGYGVRSARIEAASPEIDQFLIRIGVKGGTLDKLPEYSEPKPVTDAERQIFDAACGSYPMQLGTPVSFCVRETETSVDYEFITELPTPEGKPIRTPILVSQSKAEGATPEFIEALR